MRFYDSGWFAFLLILVIFMGILSLVAGLGAWQCSNLSNVTGRHTEYHLPGGCFVEINGELIPDDNWREFDE